MSPVKLIKRWADDINVDENYFLIFILLKISRNQKMWKPKENTEEITYDYE